MSEKCRNKHNNNNSDNPLTSRRTDGGNTTYRHEIKVQIWHYYAQMVSIWALFTLKIFQK